MSKYMIKIEMLFCFLIAFFMMTNKSSVASMIFNGSFIVLLIIILCSQKNNTPLKIQCYTVVSVCGIEVVLDILFAGRIPTIEEMKYYFIFISFIIFVLVSVTYYYPEYLSKSLKLFMFSMGVLFPLLYYFGGVQTVTSNYLAMNFSNPNLLGLWLVQVIFCGLISAVTTDRKIIRLISGLLVLLNAGLLFKSGCRTAMLAALLGIGLLVFFRYRGSRYPKLVLGIVAIAPLLVLIIYIKGFDVWNSLDYIVSLETETKNFSSRIGIWTNALNMLRNKYLFGSYSTLAGNLHNSHLTLIGSYGIVGMTMTTIYCYKVMNHINNQCNTFQQKLCLTGFIAAYLTGIGEGSLFSGGLGMYIMTCSFLLMARCSNMRRR